MKIILEFSSYAEMRSFCESTLGQTTAGDQPAARGPQTNQVHAVQGLQSGQDALANQLAQAGIQPLGKQTARQVDASPMDPAAKLGPANFRTMKTLRQVVSALSGSTESAATIVEACVALKKRADCPPPLTVISDDQLEDRVLATCEAMGIPLGT